MDISELVRTAFMRKFGGEPTFLVRAPGRVNLIGEHTDYNDGFALPMAIDRAIWIALRPRGDRIVRVDSLDYKGTVEFSLDDLQKGKGWVEYVKGVANGLQVDGFSLAGWEGVLGGDVPKGAGLSSSAAVEMAALKAFAIASKLEIQPKDMAVIGQRCENHWIGVKSGIMDQMVSAAAHEGHALFLDCRSLEYEHIPLPPDVAVVVMDTSTRRGLVDSAYNERREQCEAAAEFFGVKALRDVSLERFNKESRKMEEVVMRRARHIISENERVLEAVKAMRVGDIQGLGKLFNESHASLRDDFEVSSEALNQIVEAAQSQPRCYGARMTGAGFGGCAVALVKRRRVEAFVEAMGKAYFSASGLKSSIYVCSPAQGANVQNKEQASCHLLL